MKRLILVSVLAMFIAAPAWGQPASEPKTKTPVTKVEVKKEESATTPVAKTTEVEEKAIEPVAVAPAVPKTDDDGMGYGGLAIQYAMKLGFFVVSLLLAVFIRVLMKKFGFEDQANKVDDVLKRAAGFAEQWALKKAKVDGEAKPGGPEKMKEAICFAVKLAQEYKLPKKGEDWWEEKLESWLGVGNNS